MTSRANRKVLMVCLGNICRSPTAQAVLERQLQEAGLDERVLVDSAGTADYHVGKAPDPRSVEAAAQRGYDLGALRARQVSGEDYRDFDYILAMDHSNLGTLLGNCPPESVNRLQLLLDFSSGPEEEVPDPYFGGEEGFEQVLDLLESACEGLVSQLRADLAAAESDA